jgi:hypothetical protein
LKGKTREDLVALAQDAERKQFEEALHIAATVLEAVGQ